MKTIPAALQTHIAGDVTTLAVCWRITRVDGEVFRFTDHDENIVFTADQSLTVNITAGEEYLAIGGFNSSAVSVKSGLQVDNLDLSGVVNADATEGGIHLEDLRAGRFRNAEVEIFMIDWTSPDDGSIPIQRGNLGEVSLNQDAKTYEAELRGLSQRYAQKVGRIVGPNCDADLFDSRCGLTASDFAQSTIVDTVSNNRFFTVPTFETLIDPEPALTSGIRHGAVVEPSGELRLKRGPQELGTPDAPFLVSDSTDLTDIRNNEAAWYALTNDIDMTAFGYFTPIPNFRGGIDGRGFAIIGLDLDRVAATLSVTNTAFIESLEQGAVIRRLGFLGGRARSGGSASGEANAMLAIDAGPTNQDDNYGIVEDCYCIGSEIQTDGDRAAGLIAFTRDLETVRRCFAAPHISGTIGTLVGNVVGNLTGEVGPPLLEDNYADSDSGTTQDGNNVPANSETRLTTVQAGVATNFPELDFIDTWLRPEEQTAAAHDQTGTLTFTVDAANDFIARSSGSWITDGFTPGMRFTVTGSSSNDGTYNVWDVTASNLLLTEPTVLTAEGPVAASGITTVQDLYPVLQPRAI